jgi:hypothetical protein
MAKMLDLSKIDECFVLAARSYAVANLMPEPLQRVTPDQFVRCVSSWEGGLTADQALSLVRQADAAVFDPDLDDEEDDYFVVLMPSVEVSFRTREDAATFVDANEHVVEEWYRATDYEAFPCTNDGGQPEIAVQKQGPRGVFDVAVDDLVGQLHHGAASEGGEG